MPPIKLMLVDNYEIVRSGLRLLLQMQPDLEVVAEANSGVEAITLAQTYYPDVALMDVKMPGMRELEATRQLKARCPSVAILALLVDEIIYEQDDYSVQMINAGAAGCIPQDATPVDLLRAIRTVYLGELFSYCNNGACQPHCEGYSP